MGVIDSNVICATCRTENYIMSGSFWIYRFSKTCISYHFMNRILKVMKCICFRCSKLLLSDDELKKGKGKDIYETFDIIYDKSKKVKSCCNINF